LITRAISNTRNDADRPGNSVLPFTEFLQPFVKGMQRDSVLAKMQGPRLPVTRNEVRAQTREFLDEWKGRIDACTADARPLLDIVLAKRIDFRYQADTDSFDLTVPIAFDRLLVAMVPAFRGLRGTQILDEKLASPTGFEPVFWP